MPGGATAPVGTSLTVLSVVAPSEVSRLVGIFMIDTASSPVWTAPPGMTEVTSVPQVGVFDEQLGDGGPTGPRTATSEAPNTSGAGGLIALVPAP